MMKGKQMPDLAQISVRFPTLMVLLAGLVSGVWISAITLRDIQHELVDLRKDMVRLTDDRYRKQDAIRDRIRDCEQAKKLNPGWKCSPIGE